MLLACGIAQADPGFRDIAKPFLDKHCMTCHDEKRAQAGFRIDRLGDDFQAAKVAEQWKEVIDRIGAGEMPPRSRPRPDPKEAASLVDWVNAPLREVDLAAKKAGGRIPMRRLNRDEFANTVRDLLKLEAKVIGPLVEDLPADGKAEGFDRLGVALFFDQTQIERNLTVTERIAARAIVGEPRKPNRLFTKHDSLRNRPPEAMVEVFPAFAHKIPRGAEDRIVKPAFIEIIQGHPTYRKEYDGWGVVDHFSIAKIAVEDGYYRFRIKATVDNRGRTETNKFCLQYGLRSLFEAETKVDLDPSGTTEALMFLRGGVGEAVKGPQVFDLLWNHTEKAVIREPKYMELVSRWTQLRGQMEQAAVKRVPQAEMDALKKKRTALEAEMNAWTGVANVYNPAFDVEKLPRLQIESIEIEGPIQKEWPPPSHKTLFFAGDERHDLDYVREIFAKFLPRAYRRPVTKEEVEAIVAIVNEAQTKSKLPFRDAMRLGLQRVLCAPGFIFLGEPAGASIGPRPLTDHELATRLSYFLWSTMPDDELFALAEAGKLRQPAVTASQVKRMLADPKATEFVRNFGGTVAVGPAITAAAFSRPPSTRTTTRRSRPRRSRNRTSSSPRSSRKTCRSRRFSTATSWS